MSKFETKREPFLVSIVRGILFGVPLGISKGILILVSKLQNPRIEKLILGFLIMLSVAFILSLGFFFEFLSSFFENLLVDAQWGRGIKYSFFYLFYLILTMPVFLIIAYLNEETKLFKNQDNKKDPNPLKMWADRLKSNKDKVYLGETFRAGKPLYLSNDQRLMHSLVVGSTGTGKTESVLLPMLAHDIAAGKGAVIIDGKGDKQLFEKIQWIVQEKKREKDFFFFGMSHKHLSSSYNPLYRGNPTEIKDKIINSMSWTEEFYRRMAEQGILAVLNAIAATGKKATFRKLYDYLTNVTVLQKLLVKTKEPVLKEDIGKMVNAFKDNKKFLSGIISDLFITSRSEYSDLLNTDDPDIDLLKAYEKNQICYFSLDLQKNADSSRRLGRMIISDLRSVSSYIQTNIPVANRHFFPVFIDDASSFLELNFIDFLNKCRSSGYAVMALCQSLSDLFFRSAPNFEQQVIENTNIKIVLRQDDPISVEKFAKIAGTRRTMISTYQTEDKMVGKGLSGTGSLREGMAFRIEPDKIRGLKRGEAVVILKSPELLTEHTKLDFFGHTEYPGTFTANTKRKLNKEEKKTIRDEGKENEKSESNVKKEEPLNKKTCLVYVDGLADE